MGGESLGESRCPDSARLRERARLLEFLKFRVLASQDAFFAAWIAGDDSPLAMPPRHVLPPLDLQAFRQWLLPLWPPAAALSDADLRACLEQAFRLYVDPPRGGRP